MSTFDEKYENAVELLRKNYGYGAFVDDFEWTGLTVLNAEFKAKKVKYDCQTIVKNGDVVEDSLRHDEFGAIIDINIKGQVTEYPDTPICRWRKIDLVSLANTCNDLYDKTIKNCEIQIKRYMHQIGLYDLFDSITYLTTTSSSPLVFSPLSNDRIMHMYFKITLHN